MTNVADALWIENVGEIYNSNEYRLLLETIFGRAGLPFTAELAVSQNGSPNMSVNVAAGRVVVDGTLSATQGFYHQYHTAQNLTVATSDPTNPRIDLVVARIRDDQYDAVTPVGDLFVVTGTPAVSPTAPSPPANSFVLAQVAVAAAAASITNANITDRRFAVGRLAALGAPIVCTSATRPASPVTGQLIVETDTGLVLQWDGAAWVTIFPTQSTDEDVRTTDAVISSASFATLPGTGPTVAVDAEVGDPVEAFVNLIWGDEATGGHLDLATLVGGAIVNRWNPTLANGASGLIGNTSLFSPRSAALGYTVQAGDITGGQIIVEPVARRTVAVNKTILGTGGHGLYLRLKNLAR